AVIYVDRPCAERAPIAAEVLPDLRTGEADQRTWRRHTPNHGLARLADRLAVLLQELGRLAGERHPHQVGPRLIGVAIPPAGEVDTEMLRHASEPDPPLMRPVRLERRKCAGEPVVVDS